MPIIKKKQKQLKPVRVLVLSLLCVIAAGTLLLCLPFASKDRSWTYPVDSLFIATSAASVTGISFFDTFSKWSLFGQTVIMLLVQIGGLGLITLVTFFNYAVGRKIGLIKASAAAGEMSVTGFIGAKRLFIRIVKYTFGIELAGAVLLGLTFVPAYGAYGVFMSLFMAISAFCNAGFDVMGVDGSSSLSGCADKPQVLIVLMLLIFLGGIGFVVWDNLASYHKTKRLLMHTKLVLIISAVLIFAGFAVYLIISLAEPEQFGELSLGERILNSLFASVSARTAGFTSIDFPLANDYSKLFTVLLMFIGAAPGSTAGGIKVTTFSILVATVAAVIRGREDAQIYAHRVPKKLVYKSVTVLILSLGFIIVSFGAIFLLNGDMEGIDILYEVVSAFTTTGFSGGVADSAGIATKIILSVTMFIGRVGPVSLLLFLTADKSSQDGSEVVPECEILIG